MDNGAAGAQRHPSRQAFAGVTDIRTTAYIAVKPVPCGRTGGGDGGGGSGGGGGCGGVGDGGIDGGGDRPGDRNGIVMLWYLELSARQVGW